MKIAIITDSHFGIHRNSDIFVESQLQFFVKEFIPYLQKNDINNIFFLGDIFDNRNSVNIKITYAIVELFEQLKNFNIFMILGNHDTYYNTTVEINSLKIFKNFDNVKIINKSESIQLENKKIFMVPWIIDQNAFIDELKKVKADVCLGHFGIIGFNLNKYRINDLGLSKEVFKQFKLVFSGHFHSRSVKDNVVYVGSPYQLDRSDIDEDRGFCVLDLEDLKYEFINNKKSIKYISIKYPEKLDEKTIEGNIVDVNVEYDDNYEEEKFLKYVDEVSKCNPIGTVNIKIENKFGLKTDEIQNYNLTTVEGLIDEYIRIQDISNKEEVQKIINDLYMEVKENV